MSFVFFLITVALYIAFLLWCLSPLVRSVKRRWLGRLRVAFALLLLAANGSPLLAIPVVGPIALFSNAAAFYVLDVILFPWTLPIYIENIRTRASATADAIEIAYPVEIAGVRYAPVVRSVCGTRKIIWGEKFFPAVNTKNAVAAIGREFAGRAGDAIIAIDQPVGDLCGLARGEAKRFEHFSPRVHVLFVAADRARSYRLSYFWGEDAVAVDNIVLQRPKIVRIETAPAHEIPIGAFWPTEAGGDDPGGRSPAVETYRALSLAVSKAGCGEFVTVGPGLKKLERTKRTGPEQIPLAERPAHCRRALGGLQLGSLPRIAPVD